MKTTSLKPAAIGSISHGTLRTEDLLQTFMQELESLVLVNGDYFSLPENFDARNRLNALVGDALDCLAEYGEEIEPEKEEHAEWLVNESLPDALNEFAPPYCYFGAHDGDGSDFGFWPSHDAIEELPLIADNSQEAIDAEQSDDYRTDVRYVNDHGNVTVYGADGSVLLDIV